MWPNDSPSLARLLHEVCRFLQISSPLYDRLQWQIPIENTMGRGWQHKEIRGLCVPKKLHRLKVKCIEKAQLQVFSVPGTEGQPLGSFGTEEVTRTMAAAQRDRWAEGRWDSLNFGWNESKQHCLRAWNRAVISAAPPQTSPTSFKHVSLPVQQLHFWGKKEPGGWTD